MNFRSHPSQIEALAKRGLWASIALVGITDRDVFRRMLATLRATTKITVVATWPKPSDQPSERIKQKGRADMVRKLALAYADRVTLLECGPIEAAERLDGQQFDGAVLFATDDDLGDAGGAWIALVKSGGMLLGTDHRDLETRSVLNVVAPGWDRLDDGLWCVRVKRSDPLHEEEGNAGPVGGADDNIDPVHAATIPPVVKRRPGRPRKHAA